MVKDLVKQMAVRPPWEPLARAVYGWVSPAGRSDRQTLEVMDRIVRPQSNCIEVGCQQGAMLREFVRRAPNGKHFAIEPVPERFARLKPRFPQVTLLNLAAGDQQGETTLRRPAATDFCGFTGRSHSGEESAREFRVLTARIDELVPGDLAVRFIKLQTLGPELPALRGATELIRRCHPYIVFEHTWGKGDEPTSRPEDVYNLLTLNGLAISNLDEWMIGNSPMARQEFCAQFARRRNARFLAHP